MNASDALAWMLGLGSAISFVRWVPKFRIAKGWVLVHFAILLLVAAGAWLEKPGIIYTATAGWLVFVWGPGLAMRRQGELGARGRFEEAARWARLGALLHPFDGMRAHATYLLAQGETYRGHFERARELFQQLTGTPAFRNLARMELLRLDADWRRVIEEVEALPATEQPAVAPHYLRALGELGEVAALLSSYARLPPAIRELGTPRLFVAAFAGRPDLVQSLLAGPLSGFPAPLHEYWLATAEQASGNAEAARARLEALLSQNELTAQARLRLAAPARHVSTSALSIDERHTLLSLEREIHALPLRMAAALYQPRKPIATVALGLSFLVVFVAGKLQPDSNGETLVRFGALVLPPDLVPGGVAWRLVAAGFLHLDEVHLAMNVLGLWVLGRLGERLGSSAAVFVGFLASSIGAYAIALFYMTASYDSPRVLIGASAGVMGLVGGLATFSAIGYFLRKDRLLGRGLRAMLAIVALQVVFDSFHPMVSSFLHLAGCACGAVLSLPYSLNVFRRAKRA
jgi:rhomboid protease GluP